MSAPLVRALVALGILAASLYFAVTTPARLGLDLRGGTQIVLETQDSPTVQATRGHRPGAGGAAPPRRRAGRRRADAGALRRPTDHRRAARAAGPARGRRGHRTDRAAALPPGRCGVARTPGPTTPGRRRRREPRPAADGEVTAARRRDGQPLRSARPRSTGEGVRRRGRPHRPADGLGGWFVTIDFTGPGRGRLGSSSPARRPAPPRATRRGASRSCWTTRSSPPRRSTRTCRATSASPAASRRSPASSPQEEAQDLAALIEGGALPVPVEVIEQRTVGPTLGAEAIDASAKAAVIGIALTGAVHRRRLPAGRRARHGRPRVLRPDLLRRPGALGATLTLPGLAGFVLAIGMASTPTCWSSSAHGRSTARQPRAGPAHARCDTGFGKAWTAIIDSNVTTLLAAGLLFFLASGPVRGLRRDAVHRCRSPRWSPRSSITRVLADWAVSARAAVSRAPGVIRHRRLGPAGSASWLTSATPT